MKTKIKYEVLFYDGKKGHVNVNYDCPDFQDIENDPFVLDGKKIADASTTTVKDQIDEWVHDLDKRDIMDKHDISIIFNWEVISAKSKETPKMDLIQREKKLTQSELVGLFVQNAPMSEDLKVEFVAVYKELKPSIKDLKFDKQIDLTFKGLKIGMKAATEAYKYINEFSNTMRGMKTDDYKSISWGKTIFDKEKMLDDARGKTVKKLNQSDENNNNYNNNLI
jgi:hypothetical protein